jgi:hypothetical protein
MPKFSYISSKKTNKIPNFESCKKSSYMTWKEPKGLNLNWPILWLKTNNQMPKFEATKKLGY